MPTIKTTILLDHTKATKIFKWIPKTTLEYGIAKTLDWYKRNIK